MAIFDFDIPSDFLKQLEQAENIDAIAPKILNASIPIVTQELIKQCSKHKDAGALVESIKATKAKKNEYGYFVCARPTGNDKKGTRNMEKLVLLEYGSGHQAPSPVVTPAVNSVKSKVLSKLQEEFNKEIE